MLEVIEFSSVIIRRFKMKKKNFLFLFSDKRIMVLCSIFFHHFFFFLNFSLIFSILLNVCVSSIIISMMLLTRLLRFLFIEDSLLSYLHVTKKKKKENIVPQLLLFGIVYSLIYAIGSSKWLTKVKSNSDKKEWKYCSWERKINFVKI